MEFTLWLQLLEWNETNISFHIHNKDVDLERQIAWKHLLLNKFGVT